MTDLDKLIAAVEGGTFLMDVLSPENELTAYDAFSGSLDAALRLHEALLPGWWYRLTKGKHGLEAIVQGDLFAGEHAEAAADHIARAWLLAILRALAARPTTPGTGEGE